MNEDLLSDLWGEPKPTKTTTKKKTTKSGHPRHREPELDLAGFDCSIGTARRMVRKSKDDNTLVPKNVPILVTKDRRCWVLKIGSSTTYPTSLTSVFMTIAREDVQLSGVSSTDDVISALEKTRDHIIEMVSGLEKKVEEWDRSEHHKQTHL